MLYIFLFWFSADSEFGSGMSTPSPAVKTEMGGDVTKAWSPTDDKGNSVSCLLSLTFLSSQFYITVSVTR